MPLRRLLSHPPDEFEQAYDEFIRLSTSLIHHQPRSRPFLVAKGHYVVEPGEQMYVWGRDREFRVRIIGYLPLADEHGAAEWPEHGPKILAPQAVYAVVEGCSSRGALDNFRREIRRVLRSVLRSLYLIKAYDPRKRGSWENQFWGEKVWLTPMVTPGQAADDWPLPFLLDAYFSNPTKKDSIDRRLRNAVHLLAQADEQRHHAIGLSLSMAAIEALLCRKGSDLANMLAENAATFLEPTSRARADAVEFIKKLYDTRSRTLHGEKLEHEKTDRRHARMLAAAVLIAVLERREFQRKAGFDPETPDDLLSELRKAKFLPGQVPGVSLSPVRQLWGVENWYGEISKASD